MIDWMLAGFPKCGTTWLGSRLNQHQDVTIQDGGATDEVQYFCTQYYYRKGWPWYQSQFSEAGEDQLVGDYSARYVQKDYCQYASHNLNPPKLIHEKFGDIPLIFSVRDPIDRMESQINYWVDNGVFHEGITMAELFNKKEWVPQKILLINMGRYMRCINYFRDFWPDEKIHVHIMERDTVDNPLAGLGTCYSHLGVDNYTPDGYSEAKNEGNYDWAMPDEWREKLRELYDKLNKKLFDYLGNEIKQW